MSHRSFTVDQANATLPLVRRIVQDLVQDYRAWRETVTQFEWISGQPGADPAERDRLGERAEELAARIEGYTSELASIGCLCKDFNVGLIDFYGRHEERDVFLCWKLGEPAVEHWHELDGGFSGRQPIDTLVSQEAGD